MQDIIFDKVCGECFMHHFGKCEFWGPEKHSSISLASQKLSRRDAHQRIVRSINTTDI
jgi:hypothetical protein